MTGSTSDLLHVVKHEDLIFDVGMHQGEDSDFYLRKGFRVVGFEANPKCVEFCQQRFADFIEQGRLIIVAGAIVDAEALGGGGQKVSFYRNETTVWGTTRAEWASRNEKQGEPSEVIDVEAIDFADAIKGHGMPHYMKIDIEGCDLVCLRALKRFWERPSYVSLESDKTGYSAVRNEIRLLRELGYDRFMAVEQSQIHLAQTPPSPAKEGKYTAYRFDKGCSGLFGAELDGRWKSMRKVLAEYRVICLGYWLFGDDGVANKWRFRGASRIQGLLQRLLRRATGSAVPGWYDTHARLALARNTE